MSDAPQSNLDNEPPIIDGPEHNRNESTWQSDDGTERNEAVNVLWWIFWVIVIGLVVVAGLFAFSIF